jgi:lipoprotein-anchoring transpeptidase ErfK/SrfK
MDGMQQASHAVKSVKRIRVDLMLQIVETFDGNERIHRFECVSGDEYHPTDKGTFKVFRKEHPYTSQKYHVPMNYAMFFTTDGKALHQYHGPAFSVLRTLKTEVSEWFGSHGCVRLDEADAKALFDWAPIGTPVDVI